jgi:hypothetical protein
MHRHHDVPLAALVVLVAVDAAALPDQPVSKCRAFHGFPCPRLTGARGRCRQAVGERDIRSTSAAAGRTLIEWRPRAVPQLRPGSPVTAGFENATVRVTSLDLHQSTPAELEQE